MSVTLTQVMEAVQQVLDDSAVSPDYLGPAARAYYDTLQETGSSRSRAAMAAIAKGAEDDRSNVQRLLDYENILTDAQSNRDAFKAYSKLHSQYGLPGVEALYDAGYQTSAAVWGFYRKCLESVPEMVRQLKLK